MVKKLKVVINKRTAQVGVETSSNVAARQDVYADVSAGVLVDLIDNRLRASNGISGGSANGLIHALDYSRQGATQDGIGPYSPGIHRPLDLNIRATYANQQPMARNYRGDDQPRTLHVFVQKENRYDGSTGIYSLRGLSRLAIVMAGVAATSKGARANLTVSASGAKPADYEDKQFDSLLAVRTYDRYESSRQSDTRSVSSSSALRRYIKDLHGLKPSSDACLIVSDFLDGAQRSDSGELTSFDWQRPISMLAATLKDRLFVLRLVSPAQTAVPYYHTIHSGRQLRLDTGAHQRLSERYAALADEKGKQIEKSMKHLRSTSLSTIDKKPFITAADFIFGEPKH